LQELKQVRTALESEGDGKARKAKSK